MTGQELVNWIAAAGALDAEIVFDITSIPGDIHGATHRLWPTTNAQLDVPFDGDGRASFVLELVVAPKL